MGEGTKTFSRITGTNETNELCNANHSKRHYDLGALGHHFSNLLQNVSHQP